MFKFKTPKTLALECKKRIVGQDNAIEQLSAYIFSYVLYHYSQFSDIKLDNKGNALLLGQSGCGKTYIVKTMVELMGFQFIEINSKEIGPDGAWSGKSLRQLIIDGVHTTLSIQQEKHPWTIVFIDEADKICCQMKANDSDNFNQNIQHSILKVLENGIIAGEFNKQLYKIDTSKLCFILSGNFQSIRDNRKAEPAIGFHSASVSTKEHALRKELEDFGMVPELIGRMSHIIELEVLTDADYSAIIMNENFFFNKYLRLFKALNFNLYNVNVQELLDQIDTSRLGVRAIIQEFSNVVNKLILENDDKLELMSNYFDYLNGSIQQFNQKLYKGT